jgi:site-specific recombinase XerD
MSTQQTIPYLTIVKLDNEDVPVAVDLGVGPNDDVNGFLLSRYYYRKEFATHDYMPKILTPITIKNMADHMRTLMNALADLKKHYLYLTGAGLVKILDMARENGKSEDTLQVYLNTWRQFYEYLSRENVDHACIDLPPKYKKKVRKDASQKDDDPFSHAKSDTKTITIDPCINQRRKKNYKDYSDHVLSLEENDKVLAELAKIDIVYAVMAAIQFQTLLRINEVVTYFPNKKNGLNPDWNNYSQMRRQELKKQKFHFIGKGSVDNEREIDVAFEEVEMIFKYYMSVKEVGDTTAYTQRFSLFITKYLTSKKGKKSQWTTDSDILWIAKSGNPVSVGMYQEAFRKVEKKLHKEGIATSVRIRSHGQRYTGGTHALWQYKKVVGVDITEANKKDIQVFLQCKYGHMDMETTLKYIATATSKRISNISEEVTEKMGERLCQTLETNCIYAPKKIIA